MISVCYGKNVLLIEVNSMEFTFRAGFQKQNTEILFCYVNDDLNTL